MYCSIHEKNVSYKCKKYPPLSIFRHTDNVPSPKRHVQYVTYPLTVESIFTTPFLHLIACEVHIHRGGSHIFTTILIARLCDERLARKIVLNLHQIQA